MIRSKSILLTVVSLAGLLTASCQTKHLRIEPFTGSGEGAPYALRFTQYNTKIKWRVTSCGMRTPRPGEAFNQVPVKPFTVSAEVTSEASYPEDPARRWLIDLDSLDGWMNTTDLSVTYENGRFKAFNAVVEDKTADTIAAVAETVGKVAALAAMVAFTGNPDECADLVEAADLATKSVERKTSLLQEARAFLAAGETQGLPSAVLRQRQGAVDVAALSLANEAQVLAKALKAVTHEQDVRWPLKGSDGPTSTIAVPTEALKKWKADTRWPDAAKITVRLDLRMVGSAGDLVPAAADPTADIDRWVKAGRLPVRLARPGALIATLLTPIPGNPPKEEELKRVDSTMIQTGEVIYVPVSYRWPRSNANGMSVDANGYLTSVTHKQSAAPAQTLAKSAGVIAEQAATIHKTPLEKLKADNDEMQAKKTNAELNAALNPKPDSPEALALKAVQGPAALKKAEFELALYTRGLALLQSMF
jgi:hypothetical protein